MALAAEATVSRPPHGAVVETFMMAHTRQLKPTSPPKSPPLAPEEPRSKQEVKRLAREALRHAIFPQLETADPRVKGRTMADKLWGGGDEVVVEAYGTADAIGALSGRTTNIVTFETTIAGNAADFDEEEFRERLAAVLGVDPSSIVLEVSGTNPFTVTSSLATVGALQTRSVTQALTAVQAGGMAAEVLGVAVTAIGPPMVTMGVSDLPAHLAAPTSPAATPVVSFSATIAGDPANFDEAAYRAAVAAALGISPSEVQLEISGTDPFTVVAKIAAASADAAASLSAAVASTLADPETARGGA